MGYNFFTPAPVANPHTAAKTNVNIKMATLSQQPKKSGGFWNKNQGDVFLAGAVAAGVMTSHMAAQHMEYKILLNEPSPVSQSISNQYMKLNETIGDIKPSIKTTNLLSENSIQQSSLDSVFPNGKYDVAYSAPDHL